MPQFEYKMLVPVQIGYSIRKDGSVSIDTVSAPDGEEIDKLIDANAPYIMRMAFRHNQEEPLYGWVGRIG